MEGNWKNQLMETISTLDSFQKHQIILFVEYSLIKGNIIHLIFRRSSHHNKTQGSHLLSKKPK